jgi:hypothetical protein
LGDYNKETKYIYILGFLAAGGVHNSFVNTASVEKNRFLVLFIIKLNGLIIKEHIVYACAR